MLDSVVDLLADEFANVDFPESHVRSMVQARCVMRRAACPPRAHLRPASSARSFDLRLWLWLRSDCYKYRYNLNTFFIAEA